MPTSEEETPRHARRTVLAATLAVPGLTVPGLILPRSTTARAKTRTRETAMARLVIDRNFPDPDTLGLGEHFYAYATNSGDTNVQVATAAALTGPWHARPDALPPEVLPDWIGPTAQGLLNIWAPDVSRRSDGAFLLYYTAFNPDQGKQCLGAALADTPEGPFRPAGPQPLICEPEQGDVIDPASFVDTDGRRYLLYKDSRAARARGGPSTIRLRPLAADGLTRQGPDVALLQPSRPEEAGVVEAPTLVRRPEGYVLFYSANTFDSGHYFTNYATSPALTGPYTKAPGAFLSKEVFGGAITDPGGQDVPEAGDHIVFHGDLAEPGGPRGMYLAGLRWNGTHPVLTRPRAGEYARENRGYAGWPLDPR